MTKNIHCSITVGWIFYRRWAKQWEELDFKQRALPTPVPRTKVYIYKVKVHFTVESQKSKGCLYYTLEVDFSRECGAKSYPCDLQVWSCHLSCRAVGKCIIRNSGPVNSEKRNYQVRIHLPFQCSMIS